MMKNKKLLSIRAVGLLLALLTVFAFGVTAFAAETDVTVTFYDANGEKIAGTEKVFSVDTTNGLPIADITGDTEIAAALATGNVVVERWYNADGEEVTEIDGSATEVALYPGFQVTFEYPTEVATIATEGGYSVWVRSGNWNVETLLERAPENVKNIANWVIDDKGKAVGMFRVTKDVTLRAGVELSFYDYITSNTPSKTVVYGYDVAFNTISEIMYEYYGNKEEPAHAKNMWIAKSVWETALNDADDLNFVFSSGVYTANKTTTTLNELFAGAESANLYKTWNVCYNGTTYRVPAGYDKENNFVNVVELPADAINWTYEEKFEGGPAGYYLTPKYDTSTVTFNYPGAGDTLPKVGGLEENRTYTIAELIAKIEDADVREKLEGITYWVTKNNEVIDSISVEDTPIVLNAGVELSFYDYITSDTPSKTVVYGYNVAFKDIPEVMYEYYGNKEEPAHYKNAWIAESVWKTALNDADDLNFVYSSGVYVANKATTLNELFEGKGSAKLYKVWNICRVVGESTQIRRVPAGYDKENNFVNVFELPADAIGWTYEEKFEGGPAGYYLTPKYDTISVTFNYPGADETNLPIVAGLQKNTEYSIAELIEMVEDETVKAELAKIKTWVKGDNDVVTTNVKGDAPITLNAGMKVAFYNAYGNTTALHEGTYRYDLSFARIHAYFAGLNYDNDISSAARGTWFDGIGAYTELDSIDAKYDSEDTLYSILDATAVTSGEVVKLYPVAQINYYVTSMEKPDSTCYTAVGSGYTGYYSLPDNASGWAVDEYGINGHVVTVTAIYTLTLKADNKIVAEIEFYPGDTLEDIEGRLSDGGNGFPKVPNKKGYYGKWQDFTLDGGNIVVKAVYTAKTYKVIFDANGGTGEEMRKQTFSYDREEALNKNEYVREGFYFMGWNTEADGTGTPYADEAEVKNLTILGSVTLYAQWSEIPPVIHTVTFKANGSVIATVEFEEGDTKLSSVPTVPARDGYAGNWENYTLGTSDITVNAVYTANTYTIVFDANGGTGTMAPITATYDAFVALTPNAFVNDGFDFAGWNTKADGSGVSIADGESIKNLAASGSVTIYAQWNEVETTTTETTTVETTTVETTTAAPVEEESNVGLIAGIIGAALLAIAGGVGGFLVYKKKKNGAN